MAVVITKQPIEAVEESPKELADGDAQPLIVEATGSEPMTFAWTKGSEPQGEGTIADAENGAKRSTLTVTMDSAGTAAGEYECAVKDADPSSATTTAVLIQRKSAPRPPGNGASGGNNVEAPIGSLVYDSAFAGRAATYLVLAGVVTLALLALLGGIAFDAKVNSDDEGLWRALSAMIIALGLLAIAVLLAAGGLYVLIVEMRGRMKVPDAPPNTINMGLGADHIKAVGEVINSVGKLRGAVAALVLACVPVVGAAWIGVSAVSEPTTTTTTTTTPPAPTPGPTPPIAPTTTTIATTTTR